MNDGFEEEEQPDEQLNATGSIEKDSVVARYNFMRALCIGNNPTQFAPLTTYGRTKEFNVVAKNHQANSKIRFISSKECASRPELYWYRQFDGMINNLSVLCPVKISDGDILWLVYGWSPSKRQLKRRKEKSQTA